MCTSSTSFLAFCLQLGLASGRGWQKMGRWQKGKVWAFITPVPFWLSCRLFLSWRPLLGDLLLQLEFWPSLLSPAPPGSVVPTIASWGTYPPLVTSLSSPHLVNSFFKLSPIILFACFISSLPWSQITNISIPTVAHAWPYFLISPVKFQNIFPFVFFSNPNHWLIELDEDNI